MGNAPKQTPTCNKLRIIVLWSQFRARQAYTEVASQSGEELDGCGWHGHCGDLARRRLGGSDMLLSVERAVLAINALGSCGLCRDRYVCKSRSVHTSRQRRGCTRRDSRAARARRVQHVQCACFLPPSLPPSLPAPRSLPGGIISFCGGGGGALLFLSARALLLVACDSFGQGRPHLPTHFWLTAQRNIMADREEFGCPQRHDSLAYALAWPDRWGDNAGVAGLDASLHTTQLLEQLAEWLHVRHSTGLPCAWLRPPSRALGAPGGVLISVNPGRPLAGLHGDKDATEKLHNAATGLRCDSKCGQQRLAWRRQRQRQR